MSPDELIEFSRRFYMERVDHWSSDKMMAGGLNTEEKEMLEKVPLREGKVLVLCLGGGREAIEFSRMGFDVTGVDFVPAMVERAKECAQEQGVKLTGLQQEISRLSLPENTYNLVWISARMYSCLPTRKKRIELLKTANKALRPGGYFAFQFFFKPKEITFYLKLFQAVARIIGFFSFGNTAYEIGDSLWQQKEFIHMFPSREKLEFEFKAGGFKVIAFKRNIDAMLGWAVLKKL